MLLSALVDVGGTLWPDTVAATARDEADRIEAVAAALPGLSRVAVAELIGQVLAQIAEGQPVAVYRPADLVIADTLGDAGYPVEHAPRVRRALSLGGSSRIRPYPFAGEFLAGLRHLGLSTVILSNTTFRDADAYASDFEPFGWNGAIDGIITSVDLGVAKPDAAMFIAALALAHSAAEQAVMIGNSETSDIAPAKALGMRAIRVAIDEPVPTATAADVVVGSLSGALSVLSEWLG